MPNAPLSITEYDVKDQNLLLRSLRKFASRIQDIEDALGKVSTSPVPSGTTSTTPNNTASLRIQDIVQQLEATGQYPLNVTGLLGILAQPQQANVSVYSTAPTGQVLQSLFDGQLIVVPGSPNDLLYYVVGGNPNTLHQLNVTGSVNVADNQFTVYDDVDNTKKFQFQASGISPATTRVFTMPDADTTLAGLSVANVFTTNQSITNSGNVATLLTITNTSSVGANAQADFKAQSDLGQALLQAHGSARTVTRCGVTLGGWAEVAANNVNGLIVDVASTGSMVFGTNGLRRGSIDGDGSWQMFGSTSTSATATSAAKTKFTAYMEDITLSTTSTGTNSSTLLLPVSSLILGVMATIKTTVTTATSVQVGDTVTNARFNTIGTMTSGSGTIGLNQWQGGVTTNAAGPVQYSADNIRLVCNVAPGAGVVRVVVFALEFTVPQV